MQKLRMQWLPLLTAWIVSAAVWTSAFAQAGESGRGSRWAMVLTLMIAVAAGVAGLGWWRKRRERERSAEIPPLLFPAARATEPRGIRPAPFAMPVPSLDTAEAPEPVVTRVPEPAAAPARTEGSRIVEGQTIRFHEPTDGTLQILPGRLEIVEGADSGHTIRFVRTSGPPEITLGRSEGPPYRHIQLRAPTVSRRHAQLRFAGTGWTIENLSQTNPVVVNGEELGAEPEARTLRDGDRIEVGEVAFVFRER